MKDLIDIVAELQRAPITHKPAWPENDRCQSCGDGKAEYDFVEFRHGKAEYLKLCSDCLLAEGFDL